MIKEKTGEITLTTENIPEQLTERPQWVCWRREVRDGKLTKVPYTPGSGRRASSTELMTWATFERAGSHCLRSWRAALRRYRVCLLRCRPVRRHRPRQVPRPRERRDCPVGSEHHLPRA